MKNLKVFGIFEFYTYEQIQEKISEGKHYLQSGAENLPIDVVGSEKFLNELEELFKFLIQSPKEFELEQNGANLCLEQLFEGIPEKHLHECNYSLKILRSEMQMILTHDNMYLYQSVGEFVDILLEVLEK